MLEHLETIDKIRKVELRYETSLALTEAVRQGNFSLALDALQHRSAGTDMAARNPNPLRNLQNQCIILNTQLRHAMEGGIHPYRLDLLSHDIGLQIERLHSVESAELFISHILKQYCRLAQEQSFQGLSSLIHQTVTFIKDNLSANLTVRDTAKALSVHPDYLSHQFHKEMGVTFIEFLNQQRCAQARELLRNTNLQIKQISAMVGFNTISYFTKQFVRLYHQTPRDFRKENK